MNPAVFLTLAALAASVAISARAQDATAPAVPTAETAEIATPAAPVPTAERELSAPADTAVQSQPVAPVVAPAPEPPLQEVPANAIASPTPMVAPNTAVPLPPVPEPVPLTTRGRWEVDMDAALSVSAGNSSSQSLNLSFDTVYRRPEDKLAMSGQYLESSARTVSNGVPSTSLTALQWRLGGRYDRDLTPREFGFVGLDFSHDRIRELALRSVISGGVGHRLVKAKYDQWNVFGGLSYREDLYMPPGVIIDGSRRLRLGVIETLLGEESEHELTDTVRLKQKFVVYPGLATNTGTRATLDAGLAVELHKRLSLSVKLQSRYDSLAEAPAEKYDLLFFTGLTLRLRE